MAARRPAPPRARKQRESLPVIEVDVDDEEMLSAVAEQIVSAIFELTTGASPRSGKGGGDKKAKPRNEVKKARAKKAKKPKPRAKAAPVPTPRRSRRP